MVSISYWHALLMNSLIIATELPTTEESFNGMFISVIVTLV